MSSDPIPLGPLITVIVRVLALVLLVSITGLVAIGLVGDGGDPQVGATLTHIVETVIGVFVGIAAGRLARED